MREKNSAFFFYYYFISVAVVFVRFDFVWYSIPVFLPKISPTSCLEHAKLEPLLTWPTYGDLWRKISQQAYLAVVFQFFKADKHLNIYRGCVPFPFCNCLPVSPPPPPSRLFVVLAMVAEALLHEPQGTQHLFHNSCGTGLHVHAGRGPRQRQTFLRDFFFFSCWEGLQISKSFPHFLFMWLTRTHRSLV